MTGWFMKKRWEEKEEQQDEKKQFCSGNTETDTNL